MPLASPILASHLADPSPRPGVLSEGLGGKSLDWGGAGRKQWHDFPGQWGPCEEGWRGEEGEFSKPTSHRTDQPARPGPDLPQFSPKVSPPPHWKPGPSPQKGEVGTMGGKRKMCELPRPLPSPTEASLGGGWGPGPLQRPGIPKGTLRQGISSPLSSGWTLTAPSQMSTLDTKRATWVGTNSRHLEKNRECRGEEEAS